MPILMEKISQPTDQDWVDLYKIHLDDPHAEQLEQDAFQAMVQDRLAQGYIGWAGRFNDRLLGSLWLAPGDDNQHQLQDLCVRKVTRRRGVALKLLLDLKQQTELHPLVVRDQANSACVALLHKAGFKPKASTSGTDNIIREWQYTNI